MHNAKIRKHACFLSPLLKCTRSHGIVSDEGCDDEEGVETEGDVTGIRRHIWPLMSTLPNADCLAISKMLPALPVRTRTSPSFSCTRASLPWVMTKLRHSRSMSSSKSSVSLHANASSLVRNLLLTSGLYLQNSQSSGMHKARAYSRFANGSHCPHALPFDEHIHQVWYHVTVLVLTVELEESVVVARGQGRAHPKGKRHVSPFFVCCG